MFLLLPITIFEVYRKKRERKSKTLGFFNPALLISPGALPFISVGALITVFHFFSLPLALQSQLWCVLASLEGVEPHILSCCCSSPQELNGYFPPSYKLS